MLRYVCLLLCATAFARHHRHRRDANEAIQTNVNAALTKWVNGDVDGLMSHYVDDAIVINSKGKMIRGKANIKGYINSKIGRATAGSFEVKHAEVGADLAAVVGVMTVTIKKDEVEKEMKFTWLGILRKIEEAYKVVLEGYFLGDGTQHDHSSGARRKRDTIQELIRARHDDFLKKASEGKMAEAITEAYAEDSVYVKPCGGIISGREAIGTYMAETGKDAKDFSTEIVEVIDSDDLAVEVGLTKFKSPHNGEEMQHSMRHVAVWKKADDKISLRIDSMFAGDGEHVHPM
jgi:ketosteroid isomerase-like protein